MRAIGAHTVQRVYIRHSEILTTIARVELSHNVVLKTWKSAVQGDSRQLMETMRMWMLIATFCRLPVAFIVSGIH